MLCDINCFTGHWPFRHLRHASLPELLRTHAAAGVGGGLLSDFDSLFCCDPSERETKFADVVKGTPYRWAMNVNPRLCGLERDLDAMRPDAVRVCPWLHGYAVSDPALDALAAMLAERGLPLVLTARLFANREAYLLVPPDPDPAETASFLDRHPDLTVILVSFDKTELNAPALRDAVLRRENVYFDLSWIRYTAVEPLADTFGAARILYGSLHPLLCLESTRLTLEKAALSDADRKLIEDGNFSRIFDRV